MRVEKAEDSYYTDIVPGKGNFQEDKEMKKALALLLVLVLTLGCFAACNKETDGKSEKTAVTIVVAGQFGGRRPSCEGL